MKTTDSITTPSQKVTRKPTPNSKRETVRNSIMRKLRGIVMRNSTVTNWKTYEGTTFYDKIGHELIEYLIKEGVI